MVLLRFPETWVWLYLIGDYITDGQLYRDYKSHDKDLYYTISLMECKKGCDHCSNEAATIQSSHSNQQSQTKDSGGSPCCRYLVLWNEDKWNFSLEKSVVTGRSGRFLAKGEIQRARGCDLKFVEMDWVKIKYDLTCHCHSRKYTIHKVLLWYILNML